MPHRHRSLTVWLGLLAIWLTIAVPLASQWRLARAPDAIICGTERARQQSSETGGAHPALHLDACGYCSFFTHSPVVDSPALVPGVPVLLPAASATARACAAVPRDARYLRAYPRAPPENA